MLLATRHSAAQRARQKPRQWGPASAVRAAVRENCARLGLPVPVVAVPLWEGCGVLPVDVQGRQRAELLSGNGTLSGWERGGVRLTYTNRECVEITTPGLPFGTASTYAVDFNVASWPANQAHNILVNRDGITYRDFPLWTTTSSQVLACSGGVSGATTLSEKTWYAAHNTFDGTNRSLFLDGRLDGGPTSATLNTDGDRLWVGRRSDTEPNRSLDGWIRSIWVWNVGLTETQASQHAERFYTLLAPLPRRVVFDFGAGGTTHDAAATDGVSFGEPAAGAAAIFAASVLDGLALGEPATAGVASIEVGLAEGAVFAEALAAISGKEATAADGVSLGDTAAAVATLAALATDGATLGEALSSAAVFAGALADGVTLGEALAAALAVIQAEAVDGLTLTEQLTAAGILRGDAADAAVLADAAQAVATLLGATADGLTWSDLVASGAFGAAADGFAVGDAVAAALLALASIADGIAVGETVGGVATFHVRVAEGVGFSEVLAAVAAMAAAVSDGVNLGELAAGTVPTGAPAAARFTFTVGGKTLTWTVPAVGPFAPQAIGPFTH